MWLWNRTIRVVAKYPAQAIFNTNLSIITANSELLKRTS